MKTEPITSSTRNQLVLLSFLQPLPYIKFSIILFMRSCTRCLLECWLSLFVANQVLQSKGRGGSGTMPVTAHPYKIILLGYFAYFSFAVHYGASYTKARSNQQNNPQNHVAVITGFRAICPSIRVGLRRLCRLGYRTDC